VRLPSASAAGDSLLMDNPSSSSGVVSFNRVLSTTKSEPVGAQDDNFLGDELIADLQADPVPLRTSTPIVTNTVPAEFDDLAIQMVQNLLHKHHPDIAGLELGTSNKVPSNGYYLWIQNTQLQSTAISQVSCIK